MAYISAHDCPDCGVELEVTDDSDEMDVKLECPKCGSEYWGKIENSALILEGRL